MFGAVGFDSERSIRLGGIHLDLTTPIVLKAIQHLPLIHPRYLIQEPLLILRNLPKHPNLILPNSLLQRVHIEVVQVTKIEVQAGCVLDCLNQIGVLEVLVENDVVAQLRDLYRCAILGNVRRIIDQCDTYPPRWMG